MKTILITGGSGFIGSNFIVYFLEKYEQYTIVNLDLLTYAGNNENLKEVENHPRYKFIHGDICDKELVESIFSMYDIQGVIHFAAESHVDNSIVSPDAFIKTNINGTFVLLEIARNYWMKNPFEHKLGYENCRFHHISTDEVYGSLGVDGFFTEETPYAPNSPYSASKASSDMIVRSYNKTYGLNCVISNCSNNYGSKQHDEKLIPTIIRKALNNENIPIYGNGLNVRDWLYVLDHCKAIDLIFHKARLGETYNIGANNEKNNLELANFICEILDKKIPKQYSYKKQISFVQDRFGHDHRYAIDPTKIQNELHWNVNETFQMGIEKTIQWYIEKYLKVLNGSKK